MKSVRNFIVERLHSIDHSDPNAVTSPTSTTGSCKHKDNNKQKNSDENYTGTSVSGDESPNQQHQGGDDCLGILATAPASVPADKSPTSPFDFPVAPTNQKPNKNRRKISLPWGRQSSVAKNLGLSRQHTIDTPNSFRLFSRQSNNQIKV